MVIRLSVTANCWLFYGFRISANSPLTPDDGDCTTFDAIDKGFLYTLSEKLARRIVFERLSRRFVRVIGAPFKISYKITEIWCNGDLVSYPSKYLLLLW